MRVFSLEAGRVCFFLPAGMCPETEDLTVTWAKSLLRQELGENRGSAEIEAYSGEAGMLVFMRRRKAGADFAALLRQEILTGRGILIVEDFEGE